MKKGISVLLEGDLLNEGIFIISYNNFNIIYMTYIIICISDVIIK
jgi:hypothetical protein